MQKIINAVEKFSDTMYDAQDYIWKNPEVGYKEFKTNQYMIDAFTKLGYEIKQFDGITGFIAEYDTGKKGATVLVLAELDSLYCTEHPECDKSTGAVHNCGHNLQCGAVLGVAGAIKDNTINKDLTGKVKFGIVPAEEGIEISYRKTLVEKGIINFTSGKPECISRGLLDGVDLAFMVHAENHEHLNNAVYAFTLGSNGTLRKTTTIIGKASHAGGAPWDGINALNAEQLAFNGINSLRETFKEEDYVRVHSIVTHGGEAVNAVPEKVVIESYVRGATAKSIKETNYKVNRAIVGACLATGARVIIDDMAGSEPLHDDKNLTKLMCEVGKKLAGDENSVETGEWITSSTDMGDVSSVVPSVHAYVGGIVGTAHGKDYKAINPREMCLNSAKLQVATLVELLKDDSKKAYEIVKEFKPVYSSPNELIYEKKKLSASRDCIIYDDDKISINL